MREDLIEDLESAARLMDQELFDADARIIREAIEVLRAVPVWVKCSERMPEIDYSKPEHARWVEVIATDEVDVRQLRYISRGDGVAPQFEELDGKFAYMTPTRWQPLPDLPAPPKPEQEEV